MTSIVVLGTGGHGRETLETIEAIAAAGGVLDAIGFLDDDPAWTGRTVSGYPVLGTRDWLRGRAEIALAIGLGNPAPRFAVARWARENGVHVPQLVHPGCHISPRAAIGTGVLVMAGTRISTDVTLGDFVHVNVACSISHDCRLAAFATLGPAVHLAGAVAVEEGAELGTGVVARPGATVGKWSVIGAGAAIVGEIPANTIAVGVPAAVIRTRDDGWHHRP